MHTLILLRHGESAWNLANRFTGWTDVDLTEAGRGQARTAGALLRDGGFAPESAFTSVLKRAIRTLWIALDEMDRMWIPVHRDWRLNERHYGALQGLDKAQTAALHGEDQVLRWRRSYDEPPPALEPGDDRLPDGDPRYAGVGPLPRTECLKDTVARMMPLWHEAIAPRVRAGEQVLVCAHGNSLRALVKHLGGISDRGILEVNIPTGAPLVYELDADLREIRHRYLGDPARVEAAMRAVAEQGRAAA